MANGWSITQSEGAEVFFVYLTLINLILMVFNLVPIGALDGHYILPYFLSAKMAQAYRNWNHQYGNYILFGLIMLSLFGVPVFSYILGIGQALMPLIMFVSPGSDPVG
jgi:Zn-dependent protease